MAGSITVSLPRFMRPVFCMISLDIRKTGAKRPDRSKLEAVARRISLLVLQPPEPLALRTNSSVAKSRDIPSILSVGSPSRSRFKAEADLPGSSASTLALLEATSLYCSRESFGVNDFLFFLVERRDPVVDTEASFHLEGNWMLRQEPSTTIRNFFQLLLGQLLSAASAAAKAIFPFYEFCFLSEGGGGRLVPCRSV